MKFLSQWMTALILVCLFWFTVGFLLAVMSAPIVFFTDLGLSAYKSQSGQCGHDWWFERGPINGNWFCK